MLNSILVISLGASVGAVARWGLGLALNGVCAPIPLGTVAANLIGGYLIGVAVSILGHAASLPVEARLFIITGLLGGLTTFSTFSAEAVTLLARHQYGWAAAHAGAHLLGSLAMTALGILTINLIRS